MWADSHLANNKTNINTLMQCESVIKLLIIGEVIKKSLGY